MLYYRQVVVDNIERAIAAANSSSGLSHRQFMGRLREIFVSDLIRPLLTPHVKLATGLVVDQYGRQSKQIDIILYDEQVTPPVLMSAAEGVIPCHSVLATIEVKTKLDRRELKRSIDNARSVKLLSYDYDTIPLSGERGFEMVFQQKLVGLLPDDNTRKQIEHALFTVSSPACFIFALTSDLSPAKNMDDEKVRLLAEVSASNQKRKRIFIPVSGLCIADRGLVYCEATDSSGRSPVWATECAQVKRDCSGNSSKAYIADSSVLLRFLTNIVNTCAVHSHQRWRIPLDVYFNLTGKGSKKKE